MESDDTGKMGIFAFVVNVVLFLLKLAAAIVSGSVAIFSDALNSFMDILTYAIAFFSVKMAQKGPDKDHPMGHRTAEPLAAILIAITAGMISFEIFKEALGALFFGEVTPFFPPFVFGILVFSIILKFIIFVYMDKKSKKTHSSGVDAIAVDCKNDIFATSAVLIGVIASELGYPIFDPIAAIFVGLYVLYMGYKLARKNLRYLMAEAPDKKIVQKIRECAKNVKGVKKISSLTAHYMGDRINVEIGIVLSKKLKTQETHDIGEQVQKEIERMDLVSHAFVHIDYE